MRIHQKLALCTTTLISLLVAPSLPALDTDIYLKSPGGITVTRDDAPNLLMILDNSISMSTVVSNVRPPYDPATNYCATTMTGRPAGNVCDTTGNKPYDRVFWTFNKLTSPPAATTTQFFAVTKNKCLDSKTALDDAGYYPAEKIARFCTKATCGMSDSNWRSFKKSTSTYYVDAEVEYVDCRTDNNSISNSSGDGESLDDTKVPNSDATTPYVAQGSSGAFNWATYTTNTSPTLIHANYLAYLLNTSLATYDPTRLEMAKLALKEIIDAYKNIRLGFMIFNDNDSSTSTLNGGRILMKIDGMTDDRRKQMKALVDSVKADATTPLTETLWEAYRYLSGQSVDYGDNNPVRSVSSMTRSGGTVTVDTSTNHGFTTGQYVLISGAAESDYNGGFPVTVSDSNTFTYTITGTPTSPATGTITATLYRDTSGESGSTYISPFKYGCQSTHAIVVTDGDPTYDGAADTSIRQLFNPDLTTSDCSTYNSLFNADNYSAKACMKELAKWMYKNDVIPDATLDGKQSIVTHTVGFGTGISANGLTLLKTTAANGGGLYLTANDAAELADNLQALISDAITKTSSFAAPSLSINAFNRLYNRDEIYFALFKPSTTKRWDGNIKKFHLCNLQESTANKCDFGEIMDNSSPDPQPAVDADSRLKSTAVSYWGTIADGAEVTMGGSGAQIPAPANRKLYTWGAFNSKPAALTEITVDGSNNFYKDMTADPTKLGLPAGSTSADVDKVIYWMRGETESPVDTSDRDRWVMGDPLHSRPVAITYGRDSDGKDIVKLFVGANDGTVRMIDDNSGVEQWAFMPNDSNILSEQNNLMLDTTGDHFNGLDASPTIWVQDANNDGVVDPAAGDKVYMYIGMRRGGGNIYAFDVTPSPGKLTSFTDTTNTITPKLIWTIQGGTGDFGKLAQTWSRPLVANILVKGAGAGESERKPALLFGGGYSPNQDNGIPSSTDGVGNAIYIVNPTTGARIWWASFDATANLIVTGMNYSIPSDLALMDSNADGAVDRIYVGDTGANVWRIDLGNQIDYSGGSTSGGSAYQKFASLRSSGEQFARKFFYPPDIAQVKDTEYSSSQYYDIVTIGSGDREDPLDLLTTAIDTVADPSKSKEAVHNHIFALRDINYQTGPAASYTTIGLSDLYDVEDNKLGTLTGALLTAEIADFKTKKGWRLRLREPALVKLPNGVESRWVGEKVLARTVIFNGILYVTTYTPANDSNSTASCDPMEGIAKQYALNILTAVGAADFDNDGKADDRSKVIGGGIPSETVVVIREGGATGLIGTSGGAASAEGDFSNKAARTFWYEE